MSGRTLVVGDIHGAYKALEQVLERCKFKRAEDTLIVLGDVVDGWPETKEVIAHLISLQSSCIFIMGNHDHWAWNWMEFGQAPTEWVTQGGFATINSYRGGVPDSHRKFLGRGVKYFLDDTNRLYCHGGCDPDMPLDRQSRHTFLWDRNLAYKAADGKCNQSKYAEIYLGHTTTSIFGKGKPIQAKGGVILMDTGCGWEGCLSVMDVKTKEVWQSDMVYDLYPGVAGRDAKILHRHKLFNEAHNKK